MNLTRLTSLVNSQNDFIAKLHAKIGNTEYELYKEEIRKKTWKNQPNYYSHYVNLKDSVKIFF